VDGLRGTLIGTSNFHVALDFSVIALFSIIMILIGSYAFKRMKI